MNAQSVPRSGTREPSPRIVIDIRRKLQNVLMAQFPAMPLAGISYMVDRSLPHVMTRLFDDGSQDPDGVVGTPDDVKPDVLRMVMESEMDFLTGDPEALEFGKAIMEMLHTTVCAARAVGGDPATALMAQYAMSESTARERVEMIDSLERAGLL